MYDLQGSRAKDREPVSQMITIYQSEKREETGVIMECYYLNFGGDAATSYKQWLLLRIENEYEIYSVKIYFLIINNRSSIKLKKKKYSLKIYKEQI